MPEILNTQVFIERSVAKHGYLYDYSLVNYVNSKTKVKIICKKPEHGIFEQNPSHHMRGSKCPVCKTKTSSEFIEQAKEIHGSTYDYSHVLYKLGNVKVVIVCKLHGEFLQTPVNHLSGSGCPKCYGIFKKTTEDFISEAIDIHGDTYDYSMTEYKDTDSKVIIVCKIHGKFEQVASTHLRGSGCKLCSQSVSYDEKIWLDSFNIPC
jgi:hypothetical protein